MIVALVAGLVAIGTLLNGCGGPPAAARNALAISAHALVEADRIAAARYEDAADVALAESHTAEEYRAKMSKHDAVERAIRVMARSLRAAEESLDAWADGAASAFAAMAACQVAAFGDVDQAMRDAGYPPPAVIQRAVAMIAPFAGECHESE